jgi:uncharacterized membrane protein (UPF0127 family)
MTGVLFGEDGRQLAWVGLCNTARTRSRGLLGVDALALDECVLLTPCRSVHTYGMRMDIDVACLNRDLDVVAIRPSLPPKKMLLTRRFFTTRSVLEAASGAFATWGLRVGERLRADFSAGVGNAAGERS